VVEMNVLIMEITKKEMYETNGENFMVKGFTV